MEKFRFNVVLDVKNYGEPTHVIKMVECIEGNLSVSTMEQIIYDLIMTEDIIPFEEELKGTVIMDRGEIRVELDIMVDYFLFKYGRQSVEV